MAQNSDSNGQSSNGHSPNGHGGYPAGYASGYGGLFDERSGGQDSGIDLGALIYTLWRHKLTVFLGAAIVVMVAVLYLREATRQYETSSLLELSLRRPRIMGQQDAVINDASSVAAGDLLNTQMLKLQGGDLRSDVSAALRKNSRARHFLADLSDEDGNALLDEAVRIELIRRSNLVKISALTSNPVFSAEIANTYASMAVSNVFSANKAISEDAVKWLETQAQAQRVTLQQAEDALLAFQRENLIETKEAERKVGEESISSYNADLAKAVAERNAALARYTEKHPQVLALDAVIETAQKQLATEMERVRELERQTTALHSTLATLQRDRDACDVSYRGVLHRMEEARLSADENTATIKVVESASVPRIPVRPNTLLVLLAAGVVGLGFGVAMALLSDKLADRVWHIPEVTAGLGLKLLGSVPHARRMKRDKLALISQEDKFNAIAESYAGIRGVLDAGNYGKTFLVTSASAEEGKTVCCCNIAIASATSGIRTLLVDLDLRRPRMRQLFGVDLTGRNMIQAQLLSAGTHEDFNSLPVQTKVANLDLVASRATDFLNPAEVLGSARVQRFVKWAGEHYDRVIIDSPPVSVASDSMSLCWAVDSVIFVCRFNRSLKGVVRACIRRVQEVGAKIAGVVVNDVNIKKLGYGYGQAYHGYHYQPDKVYGPQGKRKRPAKTA